MGIRGARQGAVPLGLSAWLALCATGAASPGWAEGPKSTMFLDPANDRSVAETQQGTSENCRELAQQLNSLENAPLRRSTLQSRYDDECTGRRGQPPGSVASPMPEGR